MSIAGWSVGGCCNLDRMKGEMVCGACGAEFAMLRIASHQPPPGRFRPYPGHFEPYKDRNMLNLKLRLTMTNCMGPTKKLFRVRVQVRVQVRVRVQVAFRRFLAISGGFHLPKELEDQALPLLLHLVQAVLATSCQNL